MRTSLAILVCCFGCDSGSRAAPSPVPAPVPVEVILEAGTAGPRLDIQARFDVDPKPHIQPITAALAGARASCVDQLHGLAATLAVEIHGNRVHAVGRNPNGACLARAIDGTSIEDAADYGVELRVSAG